MSFLTGRRPDHSGVWNFINHFRQADCGVGEGGVRFTGDNLRVIPTKTGCEGGGASACGGSGNCCSLCTEEPNCKFWTFENNTCFLKSAMGSRVPTSDINGAVSGPTGTFSTHAQWTSHPQHFRDHGYMVAGTGKVFHTEEGGTGHKNPDENGPGMPPNEDPRSWSTGLSMQKVNDVARMWDCTMPSEHSGPAPSTCPVNASLDGTLANPGIDPEFCDKVIANDAIAKMRLLAANYGRTGQPFFMAVGFRKPHLAFRFPAPWLDKFPDLEAIPVAKHPTMDPSVPPIAHHDSTPQLNPYVPLTPHIAKQWRLYYMATIAWMDSQLGRVLDELEALQHQKDTLVVLHAE